MLQAAWHWGSSSRVVNDPLGDPSHTPLYIRLPFAWDFVDGDHMFFPCFLGLGTLEGYE